MNSFATPFNSSFVNHSSDRMTLRRVLLFVCLLVLAVTPARAQETTAAEQASASAAIQRAGTTLNTGSITGRVVSEDGRPLPDTVVYLSRMYARAPGPPTTATADSEGKFRASNLEPGLYFVNAMQPGFNMQEALSDASEPTYYRLGDSVNLTLVKGGVITGTVRDANGEPVIAIPVHVVRVRDLLGRSAAGRITGFFPERMTDDRGVYRFYGLPPGAYLVSAGGSQRFMLTNPYEYDAPTFFPSATRDTAAEVPVRGGEESANIDIRYRGERGHTISGTVSGFIETKMPTGVAITLRQAAGGGFEGTTFVMASGKPAFALNGVSDGEYELAAQQWGGGANDSAASLPKRIKIKGADITGVEIVLSPLASIAGRVQLEAPPKETCADSRGGTLMETAVNARRDEKNQAEASPLQFFSASGSVPSDQGEFRIPNLIAGTYRLSLRLPSDAWYVRSISLPNAAAAAQPATPAKAAQPKGATTTAAAPSSPLVTLATGARVANVTVQIAQDAAGLRGRVVAAAAEGAEAASLPLNMKVYLVPVERERAEDVLRYSEAQVASDGVFAFQNLAPGRYWLIARSVPETETPERTPRPLAWDADTRAKLRREAEAANTTIELQPCQRAINYELRYAPVVAKP